MKKIALLALITLSFLKPFNAQSQTKEETVNWLKSKIGGLSDNNRDRFKIDATFRDAYLVYSDGYSDNDYRRVEFSKITSIAYTHVGDQYYEIILGGNIDKVVRLYGNSESESSIKDEYNNMGNLRYKPNSYQQLKITYYFINEGLIKRIVKAYEHLATLCGAKLVKDDLFKN